MLERGTIGVQHGKRDTLYALVVHAADGIAASSANPHHLDDVLHLVLNRTKVQDIGKLVIIFHRYFRLFLFINPQRCLQR